MSYLEVGEHYYPESGPQAAQLIMRGPHGKRFSADPVVSRSGQPRGSGFRFWVEQEVLKPNQKWLPRQEVVGMMGLGQSEVSEGGWVARLNYGQEIWNEIQRAPVAARGDADLAASAMASAMSQAARQNSAGVLSARNMAVSKIASVGQKGATDLANVLNKQLAKVDSLIKVHMARSPSEQAKYMEGVKAAEEAWIRYRDPEATQKYMVAKIDAEREARGECVDWIRTPAACADELAAKGKKAALVVLGVAAGLAVLGAAVHGFAGGLGKGLATGK